MNCASANLGPGGLDEFVHAVRLSVSRRLFADNCKFLQACRRNALFLPESYKWWLCEKAAIPSMFSGSHSMEGMIGHA